VLSRESDAGAGSSSEKTWSSSPSTSSSIEVSETSRCREEVVGYEGEDGSALACTSSTTERRVRMLTG